MGYELLRTILTVFCTKIMSTPLSSYKKQALRIITNTRYKAHTEPLFEDLHLLKINDIVDVQRLSFFNMNYLKIHYQKYFRSMFQYNFSLYDIETRSNNQLYLFPTRTVCARNVLRHRIPELIYQFPADMLEKAKTHSIIAFSNDIDNHMLQLYSYSCIGPHFDVCNYIDQFNTLWNMVSLSSEAMAWYDLGQTQTQTQTGVYST